jgi:hypothetical protein
MAHIGGVEAGASREYNIVFEYVIHYSLQLLFSQREYSPGFPDSYGTSHHASSFSLWDGGAAVSVEVAGFAEERVASV